MLFPAARRQNYIPAVSTIVRAASSIVNRFCIAFSRLARGLDRLGSGLLPCFRDLMTTPWYFSIAETLEKLGEKEISRVELVAAHLERAQKLQPKLNAFVHLDAESAIARARNAEAVLSRGAALLPLSGIPLTVKSNIDVAGWPCPAGSLLRKEYVPAADAILVARLE